jgi:hypothetical protein
MFAGRCAVLNKLLITLMVQTIFFVLDLYKKCKFYIERKKRMMKTTEFTRKYNKFTKGRNKGRTENVRRVLTKLMLIDTRQTTPKTVAWLIVASLAPTSELSALARWIKEMAEFFDTMHKAGESTLLSVLERLLSSRNLCAQVTALSIEKTTLALTIMHKTGEVKTTTKVSPEPIPDITEVVMISGAALLELNTMILNPNYEYN